MTKNSARIYKIYQKLLYKPTRCLSLFNILSAIMMIKSPHVFWQTRQVQKSNSLRPAFCRRGADGVFGLHAAVAQLQAPKFRLRSCQKKILDHSHIPAATASLLRWRIYILYVIIQHLPMPASRVSINTELNFAIRLYRYISSATRLIILCFNEIETLRRLLRFFFLFPSRFRYSPVEMNCCHCHAVSLKRLRDLLAFANDNEISSSTPDIRANYPKDNNKSVAFFMETVIFLSYSFFRIMWYCCIHRWSYDEVAAMSAFLWWNSCEARESLILDNIEIFLRVEWVFFLIAFISVEYIGI